MNSTFPRRLAKRLLANPSVSKNSERVPPSALLLFLALAALVARAAEPAALIEIAPCRFQDEPWADGDSFPVLKPDGSPITIRLYGVDCVETHVAGDESNARRLRDQRRFFGVEDIEAAQQFGFAAKEKTRELLARPFQVHTAFADGRGDPQYQRVYAFVTLWDGSDLAETLVRMGLARAFGVCRERPDGMTGEEWQKSLEDLELLASKRGEGIWSITNWDKLTEERRDLRAEEAELERVQGTSKLGEGSTLELNSAARDELMQLPGVGETTALAIIENRPYSSVDDLLRVPHIGPGKLEKIRPFLRIHPSPNTVP